MPKGDNVTPRNGGDQTLSRFFEGVNYGVPSDDLLLYQLGDMVEEEQASFDNEDFQRLIDTGIRQHIEERAEIRAELATRLRLGLAQMPPQTRATASRVIEALEDIELPLKNIASLVRSYTEYLFRRLQEALEQGAEQAAEASAWIERWRDEQIATDELISHLTAIGLPAVGPAADLLFNCIEDERTSQASMEAAIRSLSNIQSSSSSRVLAHAISEPMLTEDLEVRASEAVRAFWPLPRPYILSELHSHTHEDLPYRWFQILIEVNEVYAVDLILEEFIIHGKEEAFVADLTALSELLNDSRDPELEEKILQVLNTTNTPQTVARLLEGVLRSRRPLRSIEGVDPWYRLRNLRVINKKYLRVAGLFDQGNRPEALRGIDEILDEEPGYPFAVKLKELIQTR